MYEEYKQEAEVICSVGSQLINLSEYCLKSAEEYNKMAEEREANGEDASYYREYADKQIREAKYWQKLEEIFRVRYVRGDRP